jgi:hypothetical protein
MTARRLALVLVALVGCKPHPASKTADVGGAADPLGDAEARIADNASRMRALGIELGEIDTKKKPDAPPDEQKPAGPPDEQSEDPTAPIVDDDRSNAQPKTPPPQVEPTKPAPPDPGATATNQSREDDRCTQICELADVACGLEQQVCRLADTHVGEPRYEDACWRARDQCERGRDACDECSAAC